MNKRYRIMVLCLIPFLLIGIPDTKRESTGRSLEQISRSDPHPPLYALLELNPLPTVGNPGLLTCTVSSDRDAPGTQVVIELPPDARLLSGNLTWQGDIAAGQPVTLSVSISFINGGDEALYCRTLRYIDQNNSWGDLAELYLNIGQQKSTLGYAPVPPGKRMVVGKQLEAGNGELISTEQPPLRKASEIVPPPPSNPVQTLPLEDSYLPPSNINEVACSTLTVIGWVGYADRNGIAAGADHMLVEVVNASSGAHLQWCWVDDDGNYSCPNVANPYPTGVRTVARSWTNFSPNNDILAVVNPDVGTTNDYQNAFTIWSGISVFNTPSGCIGDIGGWWIDATGADRVAFWVESDLIRGWEYIFHNTGQYQSPQETIGPATVEWKSNSATGNYYINGGNIYLKGAAPQTSITVVNHEYGHNIMYTIYGNYSPPTACPSPHDIPDASNTGCAWREGWASFFSSAVNNEPVYYYSTGGEINLETPTWGTTDWSDGDTVEGRVTGALWDILDTANEGTDTYLNGNIAEIWDTFYHQNDDTFSQYWAAWKSRGYDEKWAGMSIFQNTIDYRASKPGAFNKSSPANGVTGQAGSLTLSWGTSSGSPVYEYCIDTSNNNTCNTSWVSTGTSTSKAISGLSPSTYYYWQARASSALSQTYANAPNTWWSFNTGSAPGAFIKISPVNGVINQSAAVTLSWGASANATQYAYCYDTSNDNSCLLWVVTGASRSVTLNLNPGTTYYWQAKATNSFGNSYTAYANGSYPAFWSFTTAPVPGAFNKTSPANGVTGQSLSPTLQWGSSSGATSYEYCYDTTNDNACSSWTSNGAATSKALSGLSAGTTYYWHIRALTINGATYSNASTTAFWSFTTGSAPGAFNKSSPSNAGANYSTSPTLMWGAASGTTNYYYCYDTTNDNICINTWTSVGANTSVGLSGLNPGTTYYWHVRAANSFGVTYSNGSSSAHWSFTTGNLPGAFNKSIPANGAIDQPINPTLMWNPAGSAMFYEYCYDTTDDQTCGGSWITNSLNTSANLTGLSISTTYYWQVRAVNGIGTTYANGNTWWSFTTTATPVLIGDDFDDSILISALPSLLSLDTTTFTTAADDPAFTDCNRAPGAATVWYTFTPTLSGALVVDTKGSSYDTVLGVWTGARGSLTSLGCNDDVDSTYQSRVVSNLTANTTYYIEVAQYSAALSGSDDTKPNSDTVNGIGGNLQIFARWVDKTVVLSDGAPDGFILESSETSGLGGTMNSAATQLYTGDDAANKQYRAILSFDTSPLPDTAVVTKVVLKFKHIGFTGTSPFSAHGNLLVDVRKGAFSNSAVLQLNDFKAAASKNNVLSFTSAKVNNWYTKAFNAANFPYINLLGITQFRLRFKTDDNNDGIANFLKIYSGNAGAANRPQLVIEYYVP